VYDISAARRLAHVARQREEAAEDDAGAGAVEGEKGPSSAAAAAAFAKHDAEDDADAAMDAADSLELQRVPVASLLTRSGAAATAGGGEIVAQDDLFACLFSGRPRAAAATAASGSVSVEVKRFLAGEAAEARRAG
jgi:hypothetical protein